MLYKPKNIHKDTSKRGIVPKMEARDRLTGIYYAVGQSSPDKNRIELITKNPELLQRIQKDSEKQTVWIFHYVPPEKGYCYLTKAGNIKRNEDGSIRPKGLFYILQKRMTWRYKKERKFIKKALVHVCTPYFLQMLYFVYGSKDGDTVTLDMSNYMHQDIVEIPLWYKANTGYEMKISENKTKLFFSAEKFHQALEARKWREVNLPSKKL